MPREKKKPKPKQKSKSKEQAVSEKKTVKAAPKKKKVEAVPPPMKLKAPRYYEAVGRRKTAIARVRLWTRGEKEFLVNEKPLLQYFPTPELQETARASLQKMNVEDKFRVVAKVRGGGSSAQAEAIRHGVARALVLFNPDFKKRLRKAGYLTRDPRMRERKKFGLKRARRAPQWAKR